MESINSEKNEDLFLKAKNEYLELKWHIQLQQYKNEEEKEQLLKRLNELIKEWDFEKIDL